MIKIEVFLAGVGWKKKAGGGASQAGHWVERGQWRLRSSNPSDKFYPLIFLLSLFGSQQLNNFLRSSTICTTDDNDGDDKHFCVARFHHEWVEWGVEKREDFGSGKFTRMDFCLVCVEMPVF